LGDAANNIRQALICGKKGDHWTTKCPYKDLAAMNTLGLGSATMDGEGGGALTGFVSLEPFQPPPPPPPRAFACSRAPAVTPASHISNPCDCRGPAITAPHPPHSVPAHVVLGETPLKSNPL